MKKIQNSSKVALRNLLNIAMSDVRTTSGSNMRLIMLLAGKNYVAELMDSSVDIQYNPIPREELWRIGITKEIIDVLNEEKVVIEMEHEELKNILEFVCTS